MCEWPDLVKYETGNTWKNLTASQETQTNTSCVGGKKILNSESGNQEREKWMKFYERDEHPIYLYNSVPSLAYVQCTYAVMRVNNVIVQNDFEEFKNKNSEIL